MCEKTEAQRISRSVRTKALIADEYRKMYGWTDPVVSDGTPAFGGELFVVSQTSDQTDGEICFFSRRGIRIFGATRDLVYFLASPGNVPLLERVTSRAVIAALVFVLLVVGIFVAGFNETHFNKEVLVILGNALGVAAGFFFGQSFAGRRSEQV